MKAYKDYAQYKYKGGDYLLFLKRIGYADPSAMLNTMIDINRIVPNGVVCMYTAWTAKAGFTTRMSAAATLSLEYNT